MIDQAGWMLMNSGSTLTKGSDRPRKSAGETCCTVSDFNDGSGFRAAEIRDRVRLFRLRAQPSVLLIDASSQFLLPRRAPPAYGPDARISRLFVPT